MFCSHEIGLVRKVQVKGPNIRKHGYTRLVAAVNMMSSFLCGETTHSEKMAVELGMNTCRIFLALHKIKELSGKK